MDNVSVFGERLAELLLNQKIRVKELLIAIGINKATFYRWKRGDVKMSYDNLIKLADYFNCSIDYLLGRSDKILNLTPYSYTPFYERLRNVMNEKEITRYRIVKETGINDDYFTAWKQGSNPSMSSLMQLADYFDCSIDYLVGREG